MFEKVLTGVKKGDIVHTRYRKWIYVSDSKVATRVGWYDGCVEFDLLTEPEVIEMSGGKTLKLFPDDEYPTLRPMANTLKVFLVCNSDDSPYWVRRSVFGLMKFLKMVVVYGRFR